MRVRRQLGITLVELLITLAIIAVTLGMTVSHWAPVLQQRRTLGIANELLTDLQLARTEAVSRQQNVRVTFSPSAATPDCYVVHTGPAVACTCAQPAPTACTTDATLIKQVTIDPDSGVSIHSNVRSLSFQGILGTVTPTGSITISSADGRALKHVVNVVGRVRTCAPNSEVWGYRRCP